MVGSSVEEGDGDKYNFYLFKARLGFRFRAGLLVVLVGNMWD